MKRAERETDETPVMAVWPSICAYAPGRWLGRLYQNPIGFTYFGGVPVTLGWIFVLLTAPVAVVLYFDKILPRLPLGVIGVSNGRCRRYRLTNRRIVVDHPFSGAQYAETALDDFDAIEIVVQPGQQWFHAGDLVFRSNGERKLRLYGVPRPETFRQACLKMQAAQQGVREALLAG